MYDRAVFVYNSTRKCTYRNGGSMPDGTRSYQDGHTDGQAIKELICDLDLTTEQVQTVLKECQRRKLHYHPLVDLQLYSNGLKAGYHLFPDAIHTEGEERLSFQTSDGARMRNFALACAGTTPLAHALRERYPQLEVIQEWTCAHGWLGAYHAHDYYAAHILGFQTDTGVVATVPATSIAPDVLHVLAHLFGAKEVR
jgi:hypothetical protein